MSGTRHKRKEEKEVISDSFLRQKMELEETVP